LVLVLSGYEGIKRKDKTGGSCLFSNRGVCL
jgi:hypothetical protein